MFDLYDSDGDGFISYEEAYKYLAEVVNTSVESSKNMYEVIALGHAVIEWMDYDKDGSLSYSDYVHACHEMPMLTACFQNVIRIYKALYSDGLYSYGLYSYGLYGYGIYSYGMYSYGLYR